MRRFLVLTGSLAVLSAALSLPARADSLVNNVGIPSPALTITFGEIVLPSESPVTNEYAAFGVTFSPSLFYNTQPLFFPTESLSNFNFSNGLSLPASIVFSQVQTAAAFAVQTNPGTTLFEALLNNVVVDSFSSATASSLLPDTSQASNFYGFTNVAFNEIRITPDTTFFQMDNLQLGTAAAGAPEPGTLALLGVGLGVAGLAIRRRMR